MSLNSVKIELMKTYNINYVIGELEKAPDIQLGHITIFDPNIGTVVHMYHVDKKRLEELKKEIDKVVKEGKAEHEKRGKKYVGIYDITVLSITDPFVKYERYTKFYEELYSDVEEKIETSKKGSVAAPKDAIINEAIKMGFFEGDDRTIIDKEHEFLYGLHIYFKRKGIDTGTISGGKFITFEKKEFRPKSVPRTIIESESEYEKYRSYTKFYENIFRQIVEGIEISQKKEIAAPVESMVDEAKKLGFDVEGKENDLIRGMEIYFNTRNITTEVIKDLKDKEFVIFRRP